MWEKLVGRTKVETASFYTCWTLLGLAGRKKANAQYERECTSTRWSFAAPCAYRAREIRGNKPKQRQATEKKKEPLPLGVGMGTDLSFRSLSHLACRIQASTFSTCPRALIFVAGAK